MSVLAIAQDELLKITEYICLSAVFTEGILTFPSEAFGEQVIAVQIRLVVAICMHACHLCENTVACDGAVRRYGYAGIVFYKTANEVELALDNVGVCIKLVLQYRLHACERCISGTLTKTVDGSVYPLAAAEHGGKHVGDGEVIVVMGVEVEMYLRIKFHHLSHEEEKFKRIEYAESVGKHKPFYLAVAECINHLENVIGRILYSVTPILKIYVDVYPHLMSEGDISAYISEMLFRSLLQLVDAMVFRSLA